MVEDQDPDPPGPRSPINKSENDSPWNIYLTYCLKVITSSQYSPLPLGNGLCLILIVSNSSQTTDFLHTHQSSLPVNASWYGQLMAVYMSILRHYKYYPCHMMVHQSVERRQKVDGLRKAQLLTHGLYCFDSLVYNAGQDRIFYQMRPTRNRAYLNGRRV